MHLPASGRRNAYALRCSLVGAASGFAAGVVTVTTFLHFNVASIGSLLARVETPMAPTAWLILPAAFAALGFVVGPALAGPPLIDVDVGLDD